jgi:hypothetical protein
MSNKIATLEAVLNALMRRYRERVPDVRAIVDAMIREQLIYSESEIENDHIAFRSLGVPCLGIASLEKVFLHLGYTRQDRYDFPTKKLNAYWYAPPAPHYPRIFLSELRVRELSEDSRSIIRRYTKHIFADPVDGLDLNDPVAIDGFLHTSSWPVPRLDDYRSLVAENEYAGWAIYNRYYLNHFTIALNRLPNGYNRVEAFNGFLERAGFRLNDAGGKVKTSPDGLLLQSSTVARMVEANFAGGHKSELIPGSYVEFAERRVLPEFAHLAPQDVRREHRREGFEAGNADKIFESTYSNQVGKN